MKSIEFYQKSGQIYVEFCEQKYPLAEFLQIPDAQFILNEMYHKIVTEYIDHIKTQIKNIDNKGEVLGIFIKNNFLEKDKTYDVVVLGNGSVMNFNLEEKKDENEN